MSWLDYYKILVACGGDLSKANPKEIIIASKRNPNSPQDALAYARKRYNNDPLIYA